MDPNTFPTKGNLILAKNSLKLAHMGYELMDKKRNIRMSAATFIHLVSHCMKCLPEKCRLTVIQPSR